MNEKIMKAGVQRSGDPGVDAKMKALVDAIDKEQAFNDKNFNVRVLSRYLRVLKDAAINGNLDDLLAKDADLKKDYDTIVKKYKLNEELEDEATLDKIRYFQGSFQDLKNIMDKKAKKDTNAMDEVEYLYPQKRSAKGTSPVYQTFGIVNNPNKVYEMKNIKPFEAFNEGEYLTMGFGAPGGMGQPGTGGAQPAGYGLGWPDYRSYTGYTMTPVMGVVNTLTDTMSKEAEAYDKNDNPEHTASSYLKEAHKCIMDGLKECYDRYGVAEEMWESEVYEEFDAAKKNQVIKDRNVRNQKGMEMAKVKGDKQGEKLYQLKLQIDQLDLQKTKLKDEVTKIADERKKQREKIQSIAK